MDKRILQERMRRKQRQLRRRKIMRLAGCVLGALLIIVLLFKVIISPLAHRISGGESKVVEEAQAGTQEEDTGQAVRMPVKDAANASKAAVLTAGWQEDENGKWYQNADGTYYANGLLEIDGKTYYVNENGYIQTGWVSIDGKDYMFDEEGVYQEGKQRMMVALTFDDGPGERTMELLECLEQYNAHATFFMVGEKAQVYPDAIRKMQEIGCELGNHSYNHPELTTLTLDQVSNQFRKTNSIISDACGSQATVGRTPFGAQDEEILNAVGMPCFMWSIDTLDWETRDADNTYNVTMDEVSDGAIVLMHDIHSPTVDAALRLIPALTEAGYKLVTVSEMAAAKGVTLEAGKSYTDFYPQTVAALTGTEVSEDETDGTDNTSDSDSDNYSDSDSGSDSDSDSDSDSGY